MKSITAKGRWVLISAFPDGKTIRIGMAFRRTRKVLMLSADMLMMSLDGFEIHIKQRKILFRT